jgi:adenylate kinase
MTIDRPELVFVGGIHGVGKSTFSNSVASTLGISCLNAGQLISQYQNADRSAEKAVEDVALNQVDLIEALRYSSRISSPFLLDGHFCLVNKADAVEPIHENTFKEIAPIAAIVLRDNVERIRARLRRRDNREYSENKLREFQDAELKHARHICDVLRLPLQVISPEDVAIGESFVRKHLKV